VPKMLIDRDGDSANNGSGFGKTCQGSIRQFRPRPVSRLPAGIDQMRPGERQLWRVLNASAITYLNLAVIFKRAAQQLGLVAIDAYR